MALKGRLRITHRAMPIGEGEFRAAQLQVDPKRLRTDPNVLTGQGDVIVDDAWLEIAIADKWMSAARMIIQDGQAVVAELRVFPRERDPGAGQAGEWSAEVLGNRATVPGGGVTKGLLRRIPMRESAAHLRSLLKAWQAAGGFPAQTVEQGFPGVVLTDRPRPERGTGRPDLFFAKLASDYADLVAKDPRRPVAELARRRGFKPAKIRDMLREARERGLLSFSRRGQAGGELTARAREILRQRAKHVRGSR
jgi:hypothetical protein